MERNRFASAGNLGIDQRGITGLETAIVLIAFVVVASVFAFAVLSTGLLSSEKSKETVLGGLQETSSTLSVRGEVIVDSNAAKTAVDLIKFNLAPASTASESVDLSTTGSVITYLDDFQGINCQNPQSFDGDPDTAECSWSSEWLIGSGEIVDPGEQVEITVTLTQPDPSFGREAGIHHTDQAQQGRGRHRNSYAARGAAGNHGREVAPAW